MTHDSLTVTVAVVGDLSKPQTEWWIEDRDYDVPYARRPKTQLRVQPSETLGGVLTKAAEVFEQPPLSAFVAFYRPSDEQGLSRRISPVVSLVDDHGRATFNNLFSEVTFAQLLRAAEAGVLGEDDPLRPYLVLQPGIGDGVLPDFETFKAIWDTLSSVLETVDTFGGVAAAGYAVRQAVVARLRRKAKAAAEVVERRGSEWESRRADPYTLSEWLDDRPWLPEEVAPLLGGTEEEAAAVLWAFGFEETPNGLWRRNVTEEAKLLGETARFGAMAHPQMASERQRRKVLDTQVRGFLETGEARPIDWEELDWLKPKGLAAVERGLSLYERVRAKFKRS